ncbi:MAG TPA: hypothetical protein VNT25_03195, partial [Allosphingosinicella sp.]|nr:hypothetical protein [Allosphingosinicella sp.]
MAVPSEMTQCAFHMVEYRTHPAVLVLADSDAAAERARGASERAGCRVAGTATVEEALERLDRQASAAAIVVELERDPGPALDRLLDRLEEDARRGHRGSVISAPTELIDAVSARISHPSIFHLCAPSEAERVLAIGLASAHQPARLHDVGKKQAMMRLQQLSEEIARIASVLSSISEDELASDRSRLAEEPCGEEITSAAIRAMIRARRLREQYFKGDLFADPAWDM